MFTHLRYLATISFLVMVGAAIYIAFYANDFKQEEIQQTTKTQVEATFASYIAPIWDRYAPVIVGHPDSPQLSNFAAETLRFFQKHPIAKITIFAPDMSQAYYNSSNDYVTTDGINRVTLFDTVTPAKGTAVSRTLKNVYLNSASGNGTSVNNGQKRTMIQLIIPIARSGATAPEALAEVYIDIGHKWEAITAKLHLFLGGVLLAFTVILAALLSTASRAESVITKQHEVNLELIAAAAQAEAQSRDKSQFLASVSHELRTPLNAIIGFSDIIRNEAKERLDKIYQDYLEDIYASGKHLLSLINDILDFSKAEAGKLQIEWAETDANKIIRNSLRMVLPRAETAQVTLIEDIPAHHLVIVIDAKKLKQVLLNLLSNAVKFTPAGGEVRCHAWMDVMTGGIHIQVRDTGIGIAPKDISRVMTPFGQVDSALSRKYEGTGLGLPLSKKFVESMGGTFNIESELKVGTNVVISLPKQPPGWGTGAITQTTSEGGEASDVAPEQPGA